MQSEKAIVTAEQKKIISSTAYTIGGALVLNGVLQLFVYPQLNQVMGAETLGRLLFVMGIVAILCPSIGQSLNTGRLLLRREMAVKNGDYNLAVLLFGGIGILVSVLIARRAVSGIGEITLFVLLLLLTCFRYYGDVEYRLSLHYRAYFLYYAIIAAGYLLGYGLYRLGAGWYLIFLLGEGAGLLFIALSGSIFRDFFARSEFFATVLKRESFLVLSYLLTNLTLNVDRLFLSAFQGDLAVTQYYVASLIGKTLVLLTAPINTILISFMTKKRIALDRGGFLRFAAAGIAGALVFFIGTQIVTPIFVKLFYPDLYEAVQPLLTIVNAGQILGLLSTYLFMVVLTFTSERWQFVLQFFHLVLLTLLIFTLGRAGLFRFSLAVLIANGIRIILVLLLGFMRAGKGGKA